MKTLKIMDYDNNVVDTGLELDLDKILRIDIEVLSGDEVATVTFTDGKKKTYDSSDCRIMDFYDGEYTIYSKSEGINIIDKWEKRESSYDCESFSEDEAIA